MWRRVARPLGRLFLAHLIAYPVFWIWGMAVMPFAFESFSIATYASKSEEEMLHMILYRVIWIAVWPGIAAHVLAIPWAFADAERRWKRFYFLTVGLGCAGAVLFGGGAWIWFLLL
jgi:ABC-type spermidine/putrescine transport system permease subunit I